MKSTLPELIEMLEEIKFFRYERMNHQSVEMAILLRNHGCGHSENRASPRMARGRPISKYKILTFPAGTAFATASSAG